LLEKQECSNTCVANISSNQSVVKKPGTFHAQAQSSSQDFTNPLISSNDACSVSSHSTAAEAGGKLCAYGYSY